MVHQFCNICIKKGSCISGIIKAKASGLKLYLYFGTKHKHAKHYISRNPGSGKFRSPHTVHISSPPLLSLQPTDSLVSFPECRPLLLMPLLQILPLITEMKNIFGDP